MSLTAVRGCAGKSSLLPTLWGGMVLGGPSGFVNLSRMSATTRLLRLLVCGASLAFCVHISSERGFFFVSENI